MLYLLTGSVACTLRLAAPVAGARSVGPRPRAPGEIRHISSVLVAGGRRILSGRPASLLRADQRLHRECVRLDAHCARGPPLLCHFSRFSRRKERKRDGVTNLSFLFFFFFSLAGGGKKKFKNTDRKANPRWRARVVGSLLGGQRERIRGRAGITSPLSVRAVRTFLESVNNRRA